MEVMEDLQYRGLKLIQDKEKFCFGIDSVLLSDFSKEIKQGEKVLDLGTGTGIIPVLLSAKTQLQNIVAIELQEEMCQIAEKNVKINHLEDKMTVIKGDIREIDKLLPPRTFDTVVTNPPYKKYGTGLINKNESKNISRHEIECSLEDIVKAASEMLKNNGKFFMVHRPERLVDIAVTLRKYSIEPKRMRFVYGKSDSKPSLILIKAVKNGKQFLQVEEPLVVYDQKNNYTDEILKIYNKE